MKRYKLELQKLHGKVYDADMVEYENGEWVKHEDVEKLVELNREMVTIFQAIYDLSWDRFCAPTIRENCKEMIAKAEGVTRNE